MVTSYSYYIAKPKRLQLLCTLLFLRSKILCRRASSCNADSARVFLRPALFRALISRCLASSQALSTPTDNISSNISSSKQHRGRFVFNILCFSRTCAWLRLLFVCGSSLPDSFLVGLHRSATFQLVCVLWMPIVTLLSVACALG